MSTLTGFLLARIAEDEAVAKKAAHLKVAGPLIRWNPGGAFLQSLALDPAERTHIARHDPARVLAECEAKRRIVERSQGAWHDPAFGDPYEAAKVFEVVLPLLALPYADHPDFNESWR